MVLSKRCVSVAASSVVRDVGRRPATLERRYKQQFNRATSSVGGDACSNLAGESPTRAQLRTHFVSMAVPMVGFGFMDNTVMLHAGHAIDVTMGVTFGLSTMAAAACGQICSDMAGVSFGGLIETAAAKLGVPMPNFTPEQRKSKTVHRVGILGQLVGVCTGCTLGLVNLFFIDTHKAQELKLAGGSESMGFTVAVSNATREGVTAVTVEGPQSVHGVIASVSTALHGAGCHILDLSGHRDNGDDSQEAGKLKLTFFLTKAGEPVDDDDLAEFARTIMAACNNPQRVGKLVNACESLRKENEDLQQEVKRLRASLEEFTISVTRSDEKKDGNQ